MKAFFEEYGFSILAAIVVIILIMMISPVGVTIRNSLDGMVRKFDSAVSNNVGGLEDKIFNNILDETANTNPSSDNVDELRDGDHIIVNNVDYIVQNYTCDISYAETCTSGIYALPVVHVIDNYYLLNFDEDELLITDQIEYELISHGNVFGFSAKATLTNSGGYRVYPIDDTYLADSEYDSYSELLISRLSFIEDLDGLLLFKYNLEVGDRVYLDINEWTTIVEIGDGYVLLDDGGLRIPIDELAIKSGKISYSK